MTLSDARIRSEGHIKNLEPQFGGRILEWFNRCWNQKLFVLIYCSKRTQDEQEELYAQGRTKEGRKVTNARGYPPQSLHIDLGKGARAVDFVPIKLENGAYIADWDNEADYSKAHDIAKSVGGIRRLDWEEPHLEDASVSGWRELVVTQKEKVVNTFKNLVGKKNPWSSR